MISGYQIKKIRWLRSTRRLFMKISKFLTCGLLNDSANILYYVAVKTG